MADASVSDSPLEAAAGAASPRAIEAFSTLANETRLSILLALWEAYEPFAEENAVTFSELRELVGVRDSGQFNYHLDKLTGHFIEKTDNGYELRRAGLQLVRTVVAGAGLTEPSLEATEIDDECTLCGAPTAISYRDEHLYHFCTQCDGYFGAQWNQPSGVLAVLELDPSGLENLHPEDMLHAAATTAYQTFESSVEGVCDACSGPMKRSLHVCPDHDSEGVCDSCGREPAVIARFHCPVCKSHHQLPPYLIVAQHPAVIAFYHERGVSLQYEVDDFEGERQRRQLLKSHDQTLIAEDPPRIRVLIEYDADELQLTLDEELNVIDIVEYS